MPKGVYKRKQVSEEECKKRSERMKGNKCHLGFKQSKESIAKANRTKLKNGTNKKTQAQKDKIRKIAIERGYGRWMLGRKLPEKTLVKMRGRTMSEENKAKMSKRLKGIKFSEEHRLKISLSHRGSKSYRWKGGISRKKHNGYLYRNWTKKVFERDNYTCQMCGAKSKKGNRVVLNAHHMKPWALFKKLRYVLENGITLCYHCHKELHKIMVVK